MRFKSLLFTLFIVLMLAPNAVAGDVVSPEQMAAKLRVDLLELQAREVELQIRLQQLDEAIKPENIEIALAGIGSTKPEELREHRRRLLAIQRDGVLAELKLLDRSRLRLEMAISTAEAAAYQESAQPAAEQSTKAKDQ